MNRKCTLLHEEIQSIKKQMKDSDSRYYYYNQYLIFNIFIFILIFIK